MDEQQPDEERQPEHGLDGSALFAAERVFEPLRDALAGSQRAVNLAEALRVQAVLATWDAMVLDEQARGRVVEDGGVQERAFGVHLAAVLKASPRGSRLLLHDALTLRQHLPAAWTSFLEGRFSWRSACLVADAGAGIPVESLTEFDRCAAELAEDLPPHVLQTALRDLRDRLDAESVRGRTERAIARRTVRAGLDADGSAFLRGSGSQTDIAAMYDGLRRLAVDAHGRDGETRSVGQLMFDLLADLVLQGARGREPDVDDPATPLERLGDPRVPGRKAIEPTVVVLVPATTVTGCGERPATLAGWGGISTEEARRMVAHAHAWTRALIDPIDDAILGFDSHERVIPRALRRLLLTRDQHCLGPCNHTAVGTDLDHTVRFADGGPTTERNLGSMCRPMHRIKDEGYVDVHRRNDGAFVWRTRWGGTLVTRPAMPVRRPDDPPPF